MSIDTDVALWLDYRSFCNMPTLRIIDDFVIISIELHNHFDAFKRSEVAKFNGLSLLPAIELLKLWSIHSRVSLSTVSSYGKLYVSLSASQLDDLIEWVTEMRIQFMSQGLVIFEESARGSTTGSDRIDSSTAEEKVIFITRPAAFKYFNVHMRIMQ